MSLRALDNNDDVERYIKVKEAIKKLEAEESRLKAIITDALTHEPGEKATHGGYVFSLQRRTSYTYSPECNEQAAHLKARQEYEEKTGLATIKSVSCWPVMKKER